MVELAGGRAVAVECGKDSNFKLSAQKLKSSLTSKTKLLVLNSPSNPTGEFLTRSELQSIAEVILEHPHLMVISDDIYNRLIFGEEGLAPHLLMVCPELKHRIVVVNGVSKTYSMTGWRLGWALGPKEVISAMSKYQSQSASWCGSIYTGCSGRSDS